jgi:hypothetical protein
MRKEGKFDGEVPTHIKYDEEMKRLIERNHRD